MLPTDRETPVQRHRIALDDLVEHVERTASGVEVVLGEDLEPVDLRGAGQDRPKVDGPEAYADSKIVDTESIHECRGRDPMEGRDPTVGSKA